MADINDELSLKAERVIRMIDRHISKIEAIPCDKMRANKDGRDEELMDLIKWRIRVAQRE